MENFTSLTSLILTNCQLHGEFPKNIFQLPKLQFLNLRLNPRLSGHLPAEFHFSGALKELTLFKTSFSGKIPSSIEKLRFLQHFRFWILKFQGLVPRSLGRLSRLTSLDLSGNNFEGQIFSSLQNLTQLSELWLEDSLLTGQIPPWIGNFTQLTTLSLKTNQFHGAVPSSLGKLTSLTRLQLSDNYFEVRILYSFQNLTQLTILDLAVNYFTDQIPSFLGNLTQVDSSITRLINLETLYLYDNEFSGTLDFDMFLGLKILVILDLSNNYLSVETKSGSNISKTSQKFLLLGLASCKLTCFPDFLRYQDRLLALDLHGNQIQAPIPEWIRNTTTEAMAISHLLSLDLSFNQIQGQLPIPPPSIIKYSASNNKFSGQVSPLFCNLSNPLMLDFSTNQLTGMLPPCLEKRHSLLIMNMSNNHFHGGIPKICAQGSNLRVIDASDNQFRGRLPRMLANCTTLEVVNLGSNQFNDDFPSWLGTLPKLRLLVLRSNSLHGSIITREQQNDHNPLLFFSSLHILDLSNNSFTGPLPSDYFKAWNAMKVKNVGNSSYLMTKFIFHSETILWTYDIASSVTIKSKGGDILYEKVQEALSVIDLSSNSSEGSIPDSLGNLQGVQVLNLSNNILTGSIPSSLGNITELESHDLSHNKLSGQIPTRLAQLTFLAVFVVSHNHLSGHILQGNQINTFGATSNEGNAGLCGNALTNKCKDYSLPPSSVVDEQQDSGSPFEFSWITIVLGVVVGQIVATKKHYWFVKTFGQRKLKRRKGKRSRR